MQIDADPAEDQQNAPDSNYVVENPTLVCCVKDLMALSYHFVCLTVHTIELSDVKCVLSE